VIDGGKGNDTILGKAGPDVFVFGKMSGADTVKGYQDDVDTLRLVGHTGGFSDLTISNQSGDKVVEHDNGTITLEDRAGVTLTASDFDFV
jgi:serralysin